MTHFILDGTTIPGPKIEWDEDPAKTALTNPEMFCRSSDYNKVRQALLDTQNWIESSGELVNVKAFLAVGDVVTDDAAAIQAALDSAASTVSGATGGIVFLPKGVYLCGSQLTIPNGVGLRGSGTDSTFIKAKGTLSATSLIRNLHQDGTQEFAFIESMEIDGNHAGGAVCSVAVVDLGSLFINSYVRDVTVLNGSNVGLRVAATNAMGPLYFENVWLANNVGHNLLCEEAAGNVGACDGLFFVNLTSEHQGTGKSAIYLKGLGSCTGWKFENVHIEMGQGGGVTTQTGITIDGVPDVLFDGVQLLTGSVPAVTAGIAITTAVQNTRIQIRGVCNENLINPVISDAKNSVTIGAIAVPIYVTPEVNVRGGLRFTPDSAAAAKSLVVQSSAGVDRAWFDKDGRLSGASLDGAGISIVGDTANNRPITLVPSAASGQANQFGWFFPAASGSVLRETSITGGFDVRTLGTDGTETHHQLSTFAAAIKGAGARAAAPSSGTHTAGEIVFVADPVAGGLAGWICLTGGTPGTWQSFGQISPISGGSNFTTVAAGIVPASGASTNMLRGDATWRTLTQVTADLNAFTSSLQGLTPASGGGTANFLRADATWAAPPAATLLAGAGEFGSGVDGAAVFDGSTAVSGFTRSGSVYTATRDAFFTNVTSGPGVTIDMTGGGTITGWDIWCNGLWTVTSGTTTVKWNGNPASAGTGGAGLSTGPKGGASGAGSTGIQNAGQPGAGVTGASNRFSAGAGGASGASLTAANAAGGTVSINVGDSVGAVETWHACRQGKLGFASANSVMAGGGGGASGAGTVGVAAGGGGGGGGGTGVIGIRQLAATGTLALEAKGGAAGAGVGGNAGGGGGGGGGTLAAGYGGSSQPGNLTMSAAGGAAGAAAGGGNAGSAGIAGATRFFALGPS